MTDVTYEYLLALYGTRPDGLLWIGGHATKFGRAAYGNPRAAADAAIRIGGLNGTGIYHRGTTLATTPAEGRGTTADTGTIYFYAVDADVTGPGHKGSALPPDRDAVRAAVAASGFPEPTTWVDSGGGLYPQWWIDEPLDVRHPDDLAAASRAFTQLQQHAAAIWEDRGWKLDPTGDLARVWRLPGTSNRKVPTAPRPCTWEGDSGRRYHLDELLAAATRTPRAKTLPSPAGTPATAGSSAGAPWQHSHALREVEKYAATVSREAHEQGNFNNTLNAAALRIGHFVPAIGTHEQAAAMLIGQCERIWGAADAADRATIESGLRAGARAPFNVIPDPTPATGFSAEVVAGFCAPPVADLDGIIEELRGVAHPDEQKARAREAVHAAAGTLTAAQKLEWRDRLKSQTGLTFGDFDAIIAAARRERKNERVLAAVQTVAGEVVTLSQPDAPLRVARELLGREPDTHRRFWRDDFYTWTGSCYQVTPAADIRSWVYARTEHAVYVHTNKEGEAENKSWLPTSHKVNQVIDALAHGALARPTSDDQVECIAVSNGVLDPATRELIPHSPDRFNLTSLPFEYQPGAACPRWLAFLAEVLPADSIAFLQQWAGYLVSGRTDQHKIASLVGAPRSGKGTIGRILTALIGPSNVTGPVLSSLTGTFGLEPLLGRSLAIFGDVKWSAHGVSDATELLKTISGGDTISVHRKNKTAWEGHLPTRFMTLSNNTPTFSDSSGALAGRMIHVHFTRSFAGQENMGLTDELLEELPGILLWALEGLTSLRSQGRFTVPASSQAIDAEVRLASAPHSLFAQERCRLDPTARIELDVMWAAWEAWCRAEGAEAGNKRWFARNLKDALPAVATDRQQVGGQKIKYVVGLALEQAPGTPGAFPANIYAMAAGNP